MAKYLNSGGIQMPSVGLGTWLSTDEKELESALNTALEIGYRHIDTANIYGNEEIIGRVLKKWFDSGKIRREDLFITTKCPTTAFNPNKIEDFMKLSLEKLQLDYVDLYLLHGAMATNPQNQTEFLPTDHLAIWKTMEQQVKAGRTKTIGLSNFNSKQIKRIRDNSEIAPANLQVELHVFLQQPKLVQFCHDNDISVVAYSPLANPSFGATVAKYEKTPREYPQALTDPTVVSIAKKLKRTPAQVLLRFWIQQDVAVIPKSVKPERVKENFELFDFSLSKEDMATLKKLDRGEKGRLLDMRFFSPECVNHPEYPYGQ